MTCSPDASSQKCRIFRRSQLSARSSATQGRAWCGLCSNTHCRARYLPPLSGVCPPVQLTRRQTAARLHTTCTAPPTRPRASHPSPGTAACRPPGAGDDTRRRWSLRAVSRSGPRRAARSQRQSVLSSMRDLRKFEYPLVKVVRPLCSH